ncbi:MAG: hypothetical protein KF795_06275 [Labilithrix sp.]|nr:hypothetical protein [Labilithrix sp.]
MRIEVRDEVLERVVTEIVRRVVREERLPSNRRQGSQPRVDPALVDPFAVSPAKLRADSEYVTPCGYCRGAGVCSCNYCGGSGRARCSNCSGSGKEVKHYKKSSRLINCKVCRASGTVVCGGCGGDGNVTCTVCSGSGYQLAWLTYDQHSRWVVHIEPQSPVVAAHPQLTEPRFLSNHELDAFSIIGIEHADGPVMLTGYRDGTGLLLGSITASLDSRLERVNRQQHVKLAVVRRDATYSMCGTEGTLVLSGKQLLGSHTPQALRAIRTRLYVWATSVAAFTVTTGIILGAFRGSSAYFATINPTLTSLWLFAVVLAIPVLGAALRSLQKRRGLRPLRPPEKMLASAAGVGLVSFLAYGLISQPRVSEVASALARPDVDRARVVVDGLKETKGDTAEVREAEDATLLAEAMRLEGDAKLRVLDAVAARDGTRAREAATLARLERVAVIRLHLDERDPDRAIAAIERWFSDSWKSDQEIAEARARAHDLAGTGCADSPCRLLAANSAVTAVSTPGRMQRASEVRTQLLTELSAREITAEPQLTRLQRMRSLSVMAKKSIAAASADAELATAAKSTADWAAAERARVPLLGASQAVVEELLEAPARASGKTTYMTVDGTQVYLVLDATKTCRGLYLVGASATARAIRGETWSSDRFLSQAVGRAATVKKPSPGTSSTSRWFEVFAPVVARWRSGELVELRIGDAAP